MKQNWPILAWAGLVAFISHIPVVAGRVWPTLTSVEWAAWVQAIGSVAAIGAAVGVAVWVPVWQEERNQKAKQARIILAVLNTSIELCGFVAALQHILKSGKVNNGTYMHIAESVRAANLDLHSVNSTDIPSSARVHLIAVRATTNILLMLLDEAHSQLGLGKSVPVTYFDQVANSTRRDEDKIRQYITASAVGYTPLPGYH